MRARLQDRALHTNIVPQTVHVREACDALSRDSENAEQLRRVSAFCKSIPFLFPQPSQPLPAGRGPHEVETLLELLTMARKAWPLLRALAHNCAKQCKGCTVSEPPTLTKKLVGLS